jgi:hypothetical protein
VSDFSEDVQKFARDADAANPEVQTQMLQTIELVLRQGSTAEVIRSKLRTFHSTAGTFARHRTCELTILCVCIHGIDSAHALLFIVAHVVQLLTPRIAPLDDSSGPSDSGD